MHLLETHDGHRFLVEELAMDSAASAVDVRPVKKSDFEWFISHSYRFDVAVWKNNIHVFTLTGCRTRYDLTEYERGKLVARVLYDELIPKGNP
jgi:hypothetical protein